MKRMVKIVLLCLMIGIASGHSHYYNAEPVSRYQTQYIDSHAECVNEDYLAKPSASVSIPFFRIRNTAGSLYWILPIIISAGFVLIILRITNLLQHMHVCSNEHSNAGKRAPPSFLCYQ